MDKNLIYLLWTLVYLPISLFLIILWVYIRRKWVYFCIRRKLDVILKNADEETKIQISEIIDYVDEANKNLKIFDYNNEQ
mgnify:CR=1 FL=1